MERNPNDVTLDRSGALTQSASKGKIFDQFPSPNQHLNTMFGLGIFTSVLMLFVLPIYFYGNTDVDTQPHRVARYRVDINCLRWAEFANLPMIGEKTAQSIVKHGQEIGGFRSLDQLLDVKGVGAKTLGKIGPFLVNANGSNIAHQDSSLSLRERALPPSEKLLFSGD